MLVKNILLLFCKDVTFSNKTMSNNERKIISTIKLRFFEKIKRLIKFVVNIELAEQSIQEFKLV